MMLEPDPSQRGTARRVLRAVQQQQSPGDWDPPTMLEQWKGLGKKWGLVGGEEAVE